MSRNVFVIGLDESGMADLERIAHADQYSFHGLLPLDRVVHAREYHIEELLSEAEQELQAFPGSVDAIVSYWDFPSSALAPLLRQRMGLPTPSLEAVLKCEHKYWSRLEQSHVVPEHVPAFCAFDPFNRDALAQIDLLYPFWIKPIKAHSSQLGFRIDDASDFEEALPRIRSGIGRLARPFDAVLAYAELPDDVVDVGGHYCIAEAIISEGQQCTLEGYVQHGQTRVYGVVDSLREGPAASTLTRYQYPSKLPEAIKDEMSRVAGRVLEHIGFDHAAFNMEFFYEPTSGAIKLLEINPRISKSHSPLFELVDGVSHQQVMVEIALGGDPGFPYREGRFAIAGKFMLRVSNDAVVEATPSVDDIEMVQRIIPGSRVEVLVQPGQQLSELLHQESYSYEVAVLFLGADSEKELETNYLRAVEMLPFAFSPRLCGDSPWLDACEQR